MAQFTELVATAIANAESRAELAASRARVVATADETRRRIERDLHDGAQQSLVHTVITLKLAKRELGDAGGPAAGCWTTRSSTPSGRTRSCASSPTGSSRRRSRAGCALRSRRWRRTCGCRCPPT